MTTEERVARALAIADGKDPDAPAWVTYPGAHASGICWRDQYGAKARAAIKEHLAALADAGLVIAPREPSVAAQDIGNEAIREEKKAGYVYRAMIAHETEGAETAMEGDQT